MAWCEGCPWKDGLLRVRGENYPGCGLYEAEPELFFSYLGLKNFLGQLLRMTAHHSKKMDHGVSYGYGTRPDGEVCVGSSVPQ